MATTAPLPEDRAGTPRRAVVTGGDSGIGAAIAVALAAGGTDVGLTFRGDEQGAQDTAAQVREQGRTAAVRRLDLSDPSTAAPVIDELAEELGGLDVLVNCAGTGSAQKVMDMDFDVWRHVLSVDLDGPFLCARRAAEHMIAAGGGGRIINITSVHEHAQRDGADDAEHTEDHTGDRHAHASRGARAGHDHPQEAEEDGEDPADETADDSPEQHQRE
ncbi:SDR family NAD(P)-dependent oxidoreductase, partial [Nocardia abscessus]|uniref:SDR family NAD(P)-dependent oxidoreductase n=1 Tax=Nocardia abscessus TaxID=120957 RepID=UPI0024558A8A